MIILLLIACVAAIVTFESLTSNCLIPVDWYQVTSGNVQVQDKYWEPRLLAWLPITVNDCRSITEFTAVIRRK